MDMEYLSIYLCLPQFVSSKSYSFQCIDLSPPWLRLFWCSLLLLMLLWMARLSFFIFQIFVSVFSSVQSLSLVRLFVTPWTAARQASLSITKSQSLLKLTSIESVMPSNHLILCHPLLFMPSMFPSIRVFSNESVLRIRWPKYWSFSFSISPSNECSGLISFRIDWLDLLAAQGTLKSFLWCHSSKVSVLRHSAFFMVQISHPYMTTGKIIALTRRTFVGKTISLTCFCFCNLCFGVISKKSSSRPMSNSFSSIFSSSSFTVLQFYIKSYI